MVYRARLPSPPSTWVGLAAYAPRPAISPVTSSFLSPPGILWCPAALRCTALHCAAHILLSHLPPQCLHLLPTSLPPRKHDSQNCASCSGLIPPSPHSPFRSHAPTPTSLVLPPLRPPPSIAPLLALVSLPVQTLHWVSRRHQIVLTSPSLNPGSAMAPYFCGIAASTHRTSTPDWPCNIHMPGQRHRGTNRSSDG